MLRSLVIFVGKNWPAMLAPAYAVLVALSTQWRGFWDGTLLYSNWSGFTVTDFVEMLLVTVLLNLNQYILFAVSDLCYLLLVITVLGAITLVVVGWGKRALAFGAAASALFVFRSIIRPVTMPSCFSTGLFFTRTPQLDCSVMFGPDFVDFGRNWDGMLAYLQFNSGSLLMFVTALGALGFMAEGRLKRSAAFGAVFIATIWLTSFMRTVAEVGAVF